jgi:hypothetical protein
MKRKQVTKVAFDTEGKIVGVLAHDIERNDVRLPYSPNSWARGFFAIQSTSRDGVIYFYAAAGRDDGSKIMKVGDLFRNIDYAIEDVYRLYGASTNGGYIEELPALSPVLANFRKNNQ